MSVLKTERFVHPEFEDEILVSYIPGTWRSTAVKGGVSYQFKLQDLLEAGWTSKKPNRFVLKKHFRKDSVSL